MKISTATLFFLFVAFSMTAQKVQLSENFEAKLTASNLEFVMPIESDYKDVFILKNDLQSYDFAIRSRKEQLEMRYIIEPYDANDPKSNLPSVRFIQLLMHLATNDQDAMMAIHNVNPTDLQLFHADWGKYAFFKLKTGFASSVQCRLLSLHQTGSGTAHILSIYKEPSIALDNRFYALQFKEFENDTQ